MLGRAETTVALKVAQLFQRVDRGAVVAKLQREAGRAGTSMAQRRAGDHQLAAPGIELEQAGPQRGPPAGMFDDHDLAIAAIGSGEDDAASTRRDDLSAGPRRDGDPA